MATTSRQVRLFLVLEAALFVTASFVHGGLLVGGYEHREARIAESVIGLVLLIGLALTWIRPGSARAAALGAQAFALIGTFVGIFTMIVGVGPQTAPDALLHAVMVALLAFGLMSTARWPAGAAQRT
jgi:hypothetical protein